jgi:hypothetical protein
LEGKIKRMFFANSVLKKYFESVIAEIKGIILAMLIISIILENKLNTNRKIICNCSHNFIKDSIDISSELSQEIEYCDICEYTKFS